MTDSPSELTTARLWATVALDVVPLISRTVFLHDDRATIVSDIVACWQRLPPAVRDTYRSCPTGSAPGRFGGDYIETIEHDALADVDVESISREQAEDLTLQGWRARLAEIRRRDILGQPPSEAWLGQFPPGIASDQLS